jgi:hypothetical protein
MTPFFIALVALIASTFRTRAAAQSADVVADQAVFLLARECRGLAIAVWLSGAEDLFLAEWKPAGRRPPYIQLNWQHSEGTDDAKS